MKDNLKGCLHGGRTWLIDIPAERWTEAPDSDDDDCELTMALADCAEPNESEVTGRTTIVQSLQQCP